MSEERVEKISLKEDVECPDFLDGLIEETWSDVSPLSRRSVSAGKRANDSGRELEDAVGETLIRHSFHICENFAEYERFLKSPQYASTKRIAVRKMPYDSIYSQLISESEQPKRSPKCEWWLNIRGLHPLEGKLHKALRPLRGIQGDVTIHIECKNQDSGGSVDEKFPFVFLNAFTVKDPVTLIILSGSGARPQSKKWLEEASAKRPVWMSKEVFDSKKVAVLHGSGEFNLLLSHLL